MKGDIAMAYGKFDFSNVQFSDEIMTMEEALKKEPSMDIPEEVIQGKKKLNISNPQIDRKNNRIGVKVNYV